MLGCVEQARFTAVRQLAKHVAQPAVPANINQKWQDLIFCILPPKVRPALQSYYELSSPLPLDSSFDPSVSTRLSSGHEIDYSQFRIGFGKTFGVRSQDVQINALREVDQCTINGLLRLDPRFLGLDSSRQETLLKSATWTSWSAAEKDLSTQVGEQEAEEMRLGLNQPVKPNRPFVKKPPGKKDKDGEKQ